LAYPFDFILDVCFVVKGGSVEQTARVTNVGQEIMPASIGFHPGFRWPLPSPSPDAELPRDEHLLLFEADEYAPVRRPVNRLLSRRSEPTPIVDRRLRLSDGLFAGGAIIFDKLASRSIWFGIIGEPGVRLDFDTPHLGLWMLPGARFLCIEPWQGYACPEDFSGEILEKPGMIHLNPGESFSRQMVITVGVLGPERQ
jgi:galactose mutarotase-like enzyme